MSASRGARPGLEAREGAGRRGGEEPQLLRRARGRALGDGLAAGRRGAGRGAAARGGGGAGRGPGVSPGVDPPGLGNRCTYSGLHLLLCEQLVERVGQRDPLFAFQAR